MRGYRAAEPSLSTTRTGGAQTRGHRLTQIVRLVGSGNIKGERLMWPRRAGSEGLKIRYFAERAQARDVARRS
jgi:hypothetical protein